MDIYTLKQDFESIIELGLRFNRDLDEIIIIIFLNSLIQKDRTT